MIGLRLAGPLSPGELSSRFPLQFFFFPLFFWVAGLSPGPADKPPLLTVPKRSVDQEGCV